MTGKCDCGEPLIQGRCWLCDSDEPADQLTDLILNDCTAAIIRAGDFADARDIVHNMADILRRFGWKMPETFEPIVYPRRVEVVDRSVRWTEPTVMLPTNIPYGKTSLSNAGPAPIPPSHPPDTEHTA